MKTEKILQFSDKTILDVRGTRHPSARGHLLFDELGLIFTFSGEKWIRPSIDGESRLATGEGTVFEPHILRYRSIRNEPF